MSGVYSQHVYDPSTKSWALLAASASYNDLSDQPVKNAAGSSSDAFINISGLEFGRYILNGYYKFDSESDVESTATPIDIVVLKDDQDRKVATYPTIENGVCVTNIVTYENNIVVSHVKQAPGVNYWRPFE